MKSFTAQQDSTAVYINICLRRFRRAWQLSRGSTCPTSAEPQVRQVRQPICLGRNSPHSRHASVHNGDQQVIAAAARLRPSRRQPSSMSTAKPIARSAVRVRDSLGKVSSSRAAGRAPAHQRPRQGLWQSILPTQCPHNWPSCRLTPAIAGFWPIGPMTDDHRKVLHARAILPVPTLEVRKACGRARHQARNGQRNANARELAGTQEIDRQKTPGMGGWGPLIQPAGNLTYSLNFAALLSKIWRRPVLKKLGVL
jgi:hypothetical protein